MELIDLPDLLWRLGSVLCPGLIALFLLILASATRVAGKRSIIIASCLILISFAATDFRAAVIQWRFAMLDSESPEANKRGLALLDSELSSKEALKLLKSANESPNVRFVLIVLLSKRHKLALLDVKNIAPLTRPAFFGDGPLARLALSHQYLTDSLPRL